MELIVEIGLVVLIFLVGYQDYKSRSIHLILPFLVLILVLSHLFIINEWYVAKYYLTINLCIASVLTSVGFLFGKFRMTQTEHSAAIGLGDIVFFFLFSPLFSPFVYVAFLLTSFLLAIIIHSILKITRRIKDERIPLLAYFSIVFIGFLIAKWWDVLRFNTPIEYYLQ